MRSSADPQNGPQDRVVFAEDVHIGDTLVLDDGDERVTGWFFDAKGRTVLEHGGRFHTYSRRQRLHIRGRA